MGWRMDVPWKVPADFWHRLRLATADLRASQLWIAEAWAQWGFARADFDSVMNYHARNRLLDLVHLHHADAEDYFLDLADWSASRADPSVLLNVVGSHDTARIRTMCDGDARDTQMLLGMHLLMPGVPMLYYGDELGLEGGNDPDCRGTYPASPSADQGRVLDGIRPLVQLRGRHKSLSHGDLRMEALRNRAFVVVRTYEGCSIRIAGNMSDHGEPLDTRFGGPWASIAGAAPTAELGITLAPRSLAIQVSDCACGA
jgi:glycosidase